MKKSKLFLIAGAVAGIVGATVVVLKNEKVRDKVAECAEKLATGLGEKVLNQDSEDEDSDSKCPYKVSTDDTDI